MNVLRYGSAGPQVELLQLALWREGALQSAPDGIFGSRTRASLLDFQRRWGLMPDGVAGAATWTALKPFLTGYRKVTVRPGDSFFRLAKRYGASLQSVLAANPTVDAQNLQPGQKVTIPLPFPVVPDNVRFTSTALEYCVEGLLARYPFLTGGSIGQSVRGLPLRLLKFGAGPHHIFYNGAHHANEWITAPLLLRWLENLAEAYASGGGFAGAEAASLFSQVTLHLVPMVNPDGVDLVTGEIAPGSGDYFAALSLNGSFDDFPGGWKSNIRGIDLNLQYPAGWEEARRIKFALGYTKPGPRDYVGPAPLVAPESRAVYEYTLRHQFALTLSYHTQGKVIYWKYADFDPPRSEEIGRELARLSGYALELTPENSAYAGYKDWFIQEFDRPGYTVEVGQGAAPLPLGQFSEIYAANERLLTYALTANL